MLGSGLLPGQLLQELAGLGRRGLHTLKWATCEALDNQGPMGKATLLQAREDGREVHLSAAAVHQHLLGRQEVRHAHPTRQAAHRGTILYRVELAVRVVEDIARVIPQAISSTT